MAFEDTAFDRGVQQKTGKGGWAKKAARVGSAGSVRSDTRAAPAIAFRGKLC